MLIAAGASVDPGDSWRGQTPLMWAAAEGHPETMQALIEAGADVDARSTIIEWERQRTDEPRDKWLPPGGWTPLLLAARESCVTCVDVLAAAGADLNIVDPERHTALIVALINGHFDVAGRLIDHGADLNMQDEVGQTALWAAVDAHTMPDSNRPPPTEMDDKLSAWDIVAKLVKAGAKVDVPLRQRVPYRTKIDRGADGILGAGTTPLLRAAKTGDAKVVKLLLEHGANPLATVGRGVTSILLAANVGTSESDRTGRRKTDAGAIETIRLLMKAGADINAADGQGRTAAHGAALWGLTDGDPVPAREQGGPDSEGQPRLDAAADRARPGRRLRLRRPRRRRPRGDRTGHRRADRCTPSGRDARERRWPPRRRRAAAGRTTIRTTNPESRHVVRNNTVWVAELPK